MCHKFTRRLQSNGDPSGFIFNELVEIPLELCSHLTFIRKHFDVMVVAEACKKEKCKQRLNRRWYLQHQKNDINIKGSWIRNRISRIHRICRSGLIFLHFVNWIFFSMLFDCVWFSSVLHDQIKIQHIIIENHFKVEQL